jgi:hypothetical protein
MLKNKRGYLIVITTLFVALVAIRHYAPKPIDWSVTYNINGKTPYSCYILNDLFSTIFPKKAIENNYDGFYLALDPGNAKHRDRVVVTIQPDTITMIVSDSVKKNIIVVTTHFGPDKYDFDALMKYVANGNDFFVSSTSFGQVFLDSLKIKISSSIIDTSTYSKGSETLFLLNPGLRNDSGYHFTKKMPLVYFSSFDTLNTLKLGTNRNGDVNFVCTKFGLGKIYIHTQPLVFTNYHLLNGNVEYASKVLSYLPVRRTVWDNYYKPDRDVNTSPMRYILSQPPLQSAYYMLLITLLLYLIVESKRRQRVIPVVKPPENRSLQFVKTIGSLYFKQQNNADLTRKKAIFFKEFLREHYFLSNISATGDCVAMISAKSGVSIDLVRQILDSINYYETAQKVSDISLIGFNRNIELFYNQCL